MMGRLTTHVLDTANGKPGNGITISLYSLAGDRNLLTTAVTNADGRTDSPLLDEDDFRAGSYELEFAVGDYFAAAGFERSQNGLLPFEMQAIVEVWPQNS